MTCASKLLFAMLLGAAFAAGCADDELRSCTTETMDCHVDLVKQWAGCSEYDPCCASKPVGAAATVQCQRDGGICVTFASGCIPKDWVRPRDGSILPDFWLPRPDGG